MEIETQEPFPKVKFNQSTSSFAFMSASNFTGLIQAYNTSFFGTLFHVSAFCFLLASHAYHEHKERIFLFMITYFFWSQIKYVFFWKCARSFKTFCYQCLPLNCKLYLLQMIFYLFHILVWKRCNCLLKGSVNFVLIIIAFVQCHLVACPLL